MEPSVFAAGVVSNAMKTKSESWYWRGGNARLVWFVTTFLGHTFFVCALHYTGVFVGLDVLTASQDSPFYKSSGLKRLEKLGSPKA